MYVNDLLATATSDALLDAFGAGMQNLELKCLGSVENVLGMRVRYEDLNGYTIDQEQIINELLHKNRLEKANAVRSLVIDEASIELESVEAKALPTHGAGTAERPTTKIFHSLVGSLLLIARCSRPDKSTVRRDAAMRRATTT